MAPAPPPSFWRIVTRFDSTHLAPWLALRNALGVGLALLTGVLLGNPSGGLLAATGALDAAFSDADDPYLQRGRRMLTATFFVSLAVFAGRWCGANHTLAITLEAACAFIAGMLLATGQTPGDIGVITLVTLIVFSAQPAPLGRAVTSGLLAFAGGLLQTLLSVALWPIQRYRPEGRALGTLYADLARVAATGAPANEAPPSTEPILIARAALAGLNPRGDVESERYLALFSQAERIRLALLTLARLRVRISREDAGAPDAAILSAALALASRVLSAIADSLAAGVLARPHPEWLAQLRDLAAQLRGPCTVPSIAAMRSDARWQLDALAGQLSSAMELAAHTTEAGGKEFQLHEASRPWNLRLAGALAVMRANLTLESSVFRHAVRLAACISLADFLTHTLHLQRAYWAPMTAAIVLKPDFTATVTRGILRLAGTFIGLAIATALFHFLEPSMGVQVLLIAVYMWVMRWAGGANYGVMVLALTGLVVLLFAVAGVPPAEVMAARALNTVAGGVLALLAYWLWPTWEQTQINESLARLLDAYRESFRTVRDAYLTPGVERDAEFAARLDRTRQGGRRARTNLEASVERLRVEPRVPAAAIAALHAILANSHRFIHAVMSLEAGILQSAAAPPRDAFLHFTNDVDKTLYFIAARLRGSPIEPSALPDLREDHRALVAGGDPHVARYALVNVEADRIANSLNTLAIEIFQWAAAGHTH